MSAFERGEVKTEDAAALRTAALPLEGETECTGENGERAGATGTVENPLHGSLPRPTPPLEDTRARRPVLAAPPRTVWEWADWCTARAAEGKVLGELSRAAGRSRPYVRRCLWLATWPAELRTVVEPRPEIFTARVLIGILATSMARYEAQNWRALRAQVERMVFEGAGAQPRKRRVPSGRDQKGRKGEPKSPSVLAQIAAQETLRSTLMTQVKVDAEEIRIRYLGEEELARLLEVLSQ